MTRTAIIAAMPAELKPLTRGWRHQRQNGVDLWRWSFADGEWTAACAGAGVQAATRAFAEVEKTGEVDQLISTGWAGALHEEFAPGQAFDVSAVIDARTGERFLTKRAEMMVDGSPRSQNRDPSTGSGQALGHPGLWLVTNPKVADAHEKLRLAETYSATLVDMEASAIARLAQMRGIPFYCIKGISDGYTDKLPDFNRFISPSGQFQTLRFAVFAILSPKHWLALIRMGENSRKAARAIAESLLELLDKDGQIRKRNGYPNQQR
jgi:adenosylhomocysteine nucleosidase